MPLPIMQTVGGSDWTEDDDDGVERNRRVKRKTIIAFIFICSVFNGSSFFFSIDSDSQVYVCRRILI